MSSSCGCDLGYYDFLSATRGLSWDGIDLRIDSEDPRPSALSIVLKFFAIGSTTPAFVMDADSGAIVIDGSAWLFQVGPIQSIAFPAGIYSYRLEVTTDVGTKEDHLQGTWTIHP